MAESLPETLRRLRGGRTQHAIAALLKVSAARVSQFEKDDGPPPPEDMLLKLAGILGSDVLRAAGWGPYAATERWHGADATVALWAMRMAVLRDTSVSSPKARERALQLANAIQTAAARSPEGWVFTTNGELASVRRITADLPLSTRILIAMEAASMVIDAPLHIISGKDLQGRARKVVGEIARDQLGVDLTEALNQYQNHSPRPKWNWQSLPCAGGPLGQIHALCSGDPGILLLKGHDPSGWIGWHMASGAWIVRPPLAAKPEQEGRDSWEKGIDIAARLGGHLAQVPLGIPSGQRLPLGDVATQRLARGPCLEAASTESLHPWLDGIDASLQSAVLTAHTLGAYWVRESVNRITAVYRGFPELPTDNGPDTLPPPTEALDTINELAHCTRTIAATEQRVGGTSSHDYNEVYRHWVDITESFEAAARTLANR